MKPCSLLLQQPSSAVLAMACLYSLIPPAYAEEANLSEAAEGEDYGEDIVVTGSIISSQQDSIAAKREEQLAIDSVVDLRSLDERDVAPDTTDDRTGALFIANDYSMKPLMAQMSKGDGENVYRGIEKTLAPQYRSLFKRLIADEGTVVYPCSAGQDRTGIATALLYDTLGIDRDTILEDYHLSTALRRPEWEMPKINPQDYPDNLIVQYYLTRGREADGRSERMRAEPLYTPKGGSHMAQFFTYIDKEYGGSEGYLKELGFTDQDLARLRQVMLD